MPRVSLTFLAVLASLALPAVAETLLGDAPGAGRTADPSAPSTVPSAPAKRAEPLPAQRAKTTFPPIAFFVAKGEPGACGRNCAEWIAADGAIDFGAAHRLRALLTRLGRRNLPIYFHSPGGSVSGALAIGHLLRERGLTAHVAWTVPQGCDPKVPRETACDRLKRSGRDLPAQLDAGHTMCNSACVYALVGAAVRQIAPGASLGIHASSFSFVDHNGHASMRPSAMLFRAQVAQSYARIASYLGEMGIDPALLTAARQVANDRIRFLNRAEIWRFNIDRRTFVESDWRLADEPARVIRKVFTSHEGGHDEFRAALIHLSCSQPDRLRVDFAREVGPGDDSAAAGIILAAGGASRVLKPSRRAVLSSRKTEFNVATASVSADFFLKAGDSISLSAASDTGVTASEPAITLSTAGLDAALARLLPTCGVAVAKPQTDGPSPVSP